MQYRQVRFCNSSCDGVTVCRNSTAPILNILPFLDHIKNVASENLIFGGSEYLIKFVLALALPIPPAHCFDRTCFPCPSESRRSEGALILFASPTYQISVTSGYSFSPMFSSMESTTLEGIGKSGQFRKLEVL